MREIGYVDAWNDEEKASDAWGHCGCVADWLVSSRD
jgi:hypothetical protein